MTDADFAAAKTLKDAIAGLQKSHDQANLSGARASILITNANGSQITSAITTKTTAFTNLGGE